MSVTSYPTSDALSVSLWEKKLATEALKATPIAPLLGTDSNSIVHVKKEFKEGGDNITFGLRMQLSGDGQTENETLEGNEESLTTYSANVTINELVHAVRVKGKDTIDNQRVLFSARDEGKMGLKDWYAKRFSVSFFNQVCGYTVQTNTKFTGLNAVTAPSSNRQIWAGTAANDQSLGSSDIFTLFMIDYAKELAETADVPIRPVTINGEEKYVMYLHPYQVTDLQTDTGTGGWRDIQKAAMMGGKISGNALYTGALGEYNGVILRKAYDVTQGVHSSTGAAQTSVRRAVLLGAQAAAMGFGKYRSSGNRYKWVEKTFDYDRELGISAQSIFGLKKTAFNSEDFGSIVVSTYAAAHT